jgi:hypothetical protein
MHSTSYRSLVLDAIFLAIIWLLASAPIEYFGWHAWAEGKKDWSGESYYFKFF